MNDLETYFTQNRGRLIYKWDHYFEIYDRYFNKYRNKEVVILEIGVFHGGSLQMWKEYFGPKAKIYGIDINPQCKQLEENGIKIFIGSQSDRNFLNEVKSQIPPIDILIDDGGHTMEQQIVSYEMLFDSIKPNGIYLCEDLHTSYWLAFGGGCQRKGTFIEYSKKLIDKLNAFHSHESFFTADSFTKSSFAIHYYDSILVVEKRKREKPLSLMTGQPSFSNEAPKRTWKNILIFYMFYSINLFLRIFKLPSICTNQIIKNS